MRRFKFRPRLGRTVGYNALPRELTPRENADVLDTPLPVRGVDQPASAPASRRIIDGPSRGGARAFVTIAAGLETGPPPTYIRRMTPAANMGAVQGGTGNGVTGPKSYDPKTDGGSLYIPHQRIPRKPITGRVFLKTIDTASTIPARGIGAPVK